MSTPVRARADGGATPEAADAMGQMQVWHLDTLAALARGEMDAQALAGQVLANRGLDADGCWIGFPAAERLWGVE